MSGLVEVHHSLGGVLDGQHECCLCSDELFAHGHHLWKVAPCPGLDTFALEVMEFEASLFFTTLLPQSLTEGSNFHLEVDYLANVTRCSSRLLLDLLLESLPGPLKRINLCRMYETCVLEFVRLLLI